jgi:hypothetical protein
VSTVIKRKPSGQAGYPESGGHRGVKAGRNRERLRILDGDQLSQGSVRRWRGCHIPAAAIHELHDSLVPGDTRGLQPAKWELVVDERHVERVQGRREQGTDRDAGAWPRIGELFKDWSGAGLTDYCCSHVFLRSKIGHVT